MVVPTRELRETMKAMAVADPMRELRETMKAMAVANPMRELRETMKAMAVANPMRELRETMKAMAVANPMRELAEGLKALSTVRREAQFVVSRQTQLDESTVGVQDEIQAAVSRLAVAAAVAEPSPTQLFQAILTEIEGLRTTRARWALSNVLLPFVISIVVWLTTRTADPYLTRILSPLANSAPQDTVRMLAKAVDEQDALRDLRVVAGKRVRVRAGKSKTAHVFDSLESGQVVVFIGKPR
jgi:hypothetical protein